MLEQLTSEQEQLMHETRDFWLNYIFSCKNSLNKDKAKIQIEWLYEFCKLQKPIVIYVDSPMSCQIAVSCLKEFLKNPPDNVRANVWANVWDNVRANVGANVGANVWANVGANVRANVGANVGDNVWANVWDNVWANVRANVWANVGANVWDNVGDNVGANVRANYENFASYGSVSDYGWVSFHDFFTKIGINNNKDFNHFKDILLSGVYDMIQLKGFCIVSDMPIEIKRNSQGLLHNVDGPAIIFKDGYCQYYINGRVLKGEYFNSISSGTFKIEDFINETNEEYKSTCIAFMQEKFGDEYLVDFFRQYLKDVDTYVDKKDEQYLTGTTGGMNVGVYTLFKGEVNGENVAYVRCYCPSTDRMFFLGVDNKYRTAKGAIASLYRIPEKLKSHISSISRQGERFSTTFTEEGKNILKSMTEKEIQSVTNIDGDAYFKLMKYEF